MTPPAPSSIGLADFVAKLVLDSFDGIRDALWIQEERRAEMVTAVSLNTVEFARQTVPDEALNLEAARLFPSPDARHPHGVYIGADYFPALKDSEIERPPFRALVGVQLEPVDYAQKRGSKNPVLAKTGVEKVLAALHTRLGAQSQSILRGTLARGIPQLFVASGSIKAKLSLTLEDATATPAGAASAIPRKDARLLVRMVDDRAPQNQQLRVDILSELEIMFKSIT